MKIRSDESPQHTIAAVARDTGVNKDTLRAWERRYGYPVPSRDANGERVYSAAEVQRLQLVKRLMDNGHRPGRLLALTPPALQALAEQAAPPSPRGAGVAPDGEAVQDCLRLVQALDVGALRQRLAREAAARGLAQFVTALVVPLNQAVGDAWLRGELPVYQEHLYTQALLSVLYQALAGLAPAPASARPRVLLATLPGEPHGLGLLMAELMFALEGARCLSLGVQTPLDELVRAAQAFDADIVALSFSGCTSPHQTVDNLRELRAALPPSRALWAGGREPVLQRRPLPQVTVVDRLEGLTLALQAWRNVAP
ncbi:MAG: MerR family transcriptional regulator [Rubrivivax sp.]|nr:MerR family transcriptional regulator [Rubrivivax sp.]MDP3083324.1 MerR family transcriptional regulator [Rubrivivax sp.]